MKRVRANKNKKKTWRKHADVSEVESFLDDIRFQERTGGIVKSKEDKDLYLIDKDTTPQTNKRRLRPHSLKSLSHLTPLNNFPDTTKLYGRFTLKKKSEIKPNYDDVVFNKKMLRTKFTQHTPRNRNLIDNSNIFAKDIWLKTSPQMHQNLELEEIYDKDYATQLKLMDPKAPPHHLAKPSSLRAIPLPHEGASYNPTFEDHQALLRKAHSIETAKLRDQDSTNKKSKVTPLPVSEIEANRINELSQGLYMEQDGTQEISSQEPQAISGGGPKVNRDNKKSNHKRRLEAVRRLQVKDRLAVKRKKIMLNDINRLRSLRKEILVEEKVRLEKMTKKERDLKVSTETGTRRLGKNKFQDGDLDLQLSSELADSLRKLKPEGNILGDSFKSFQRRNLIEAHSLGGKRKKQKRYKPKYFERKVIKNILSE